ncbi:hypothetical protein XacyCFBP2565_08620 [Xanthomonas arboricola pv. corylina]|uniref:hypothetical protein n=1 Tax=Xanthomonas arboricola TaxID=56448 RepID=UPI000CEF5662|nr:hypothetical protein [Xanthomonas arboricola]PPU15848.1 hypothetical protein XacyCFBP2565_08620 [Xanthomonas arboricola pv. corylina]
MAIEFCPLAAEWGNVADWAAVIIAVAGAGIAAVAAAIALAGAGAVGYLGWQANALVKRSEIDASNAISREADLLTILFEPELHLFGVGIGSVRRMVEVEDAPFADSRLTRDLVADHLRALTLPEITGNFERLHVLPSNFGYAISRLKGRLSALQAVAEIARGMSGEHAREFAEMIIESSSRLTDTSIEIAKIAEARRKEIFGRST